MRLCPLLQGYGHRPSLEYTKCHRDMSLLDIILAISEHTKRHCDMSLLGILLAISESGSFVFIVQQEDKSQFLQIG